MNFLPCQTSCVISKQIRLFLLTFCMVTGIALTFTGNALAVATKTWMFSGNESSKIHEITIPDDGFLDFKVVYNDTHTLVNITFQFPYNQCFNDGSEWVPTKLYETNYPPNDKYYDINIPVGPGKVEIVVNDGYREASSTYDLYVYYTEPLAWGKDPEPNFPFDKPADLGKLYPPVSIPSHTCFYTCPVGTDQSDRKDYFQFTVAKTGSYKLSYRRLEAGGGDCKTIVSLSESTKYIYYKWYLDEKDEIGTFLLSADQSYFIDLQHESGGSLSFPYYCFSSVELGLIPVDSPWLSIEDIQHSESTVCGLSPAFADDYTAVIRNDGDADAQVVVRLRLYHSKLPEVTWFYDYKELTIPAGGEREVWFEITLPDDGGLMSGEMLLELSVEYDSVVVARETTRMGVLCRPPVNAILFLLLNKKIK